MKHDVDEVLISKLVNMGFVIGNHSYSHVGMSGLVSPDLLREYMLPQLMLDKVQTDGWHLVRAPGLDFPASAAQVINGDSYLRKLRGPIGVDVGGGFKVGDKWMGGDFDCIPKGLSFSQCGDLYLRDIRTETQTHGAIVLLHHYIVPGRYAMDLLKYILDNLDRDIQIVDIREHPAFHENPNRVSPHGGGR